MVITKNINSNSPRFVLDSTSKKRRAKSIIMNYAGNSILKTQKQSETTTEKKYIPMILPKAVVLRPDMAEQFRENRSALIKTPNCIGN